jgi:hypothetical protein
MHKAVVVVKINGIKGGPYSPQNNNFLSFSKCFGFHSDEVNA